MDDDTPLQNQKLINDLSNFQKDKHIRSQSITVPGTISDANIVHHRKRFLDKIEKQLKNERKNEKEHYLTQSNQFRSSSQTYLANPISSKKYQNEYVDMSIEKAYDFRNTTEPPQNQNTLTSSLLKINTRLIANKINKKRQDGSANSENAHKRRRKRSISTKMSDLSTKINEFKRTAQELRRRKSKINNNRNINNEIKKIISQKVNKRKNK